MSTVAPQDGELMTQVSNAISRLFKAHLGVGPRRTRSHLVDGALLCLVEGGFTPLERTLTHADAAHAASQHRLALQNALQGELVNAVEHLLHRKVRSFMSSSDPDQDLQSEVFVFDDAPAAAPA